MQRIVLRFGFASGVILALVSSVSLTLCMRGNLDFASSEIVGYTAMVLSFLMVFFGIRSYRDNVVSWEIAYFNFFPHFLDQYTAHVLLKMRSTGASEAAILEQAAKLAEMAKHYGNPLYNSAITFMEIFPVGLIVTLISAAILRKKPRQDAPTAAVPA